MSSWFLRQILITHLKKNTFANWQLMIHGKLVESMAIFALLQLVRFSARLWMVAGLVTLSSAPVSEWPVSIVLWNLISRPTLYTCVWCVRMRVCTSAAAQARVKRTFSGDKTGAFLPSTFCESRLVNGTKAFLAIHVSRAHLFTDAADRLLRLLHHIPCWSCPTFRRSQPLL